MSSSPGALGMTLKCVRVMQTVCSIPIIGISANFISQIIAFNQSPPQVLIGTISVTCVALLYAAITFILYLDAMLPFLLAAIADGLFLIAFIVVAIVVGQPLTYLNCQAIGSPSASGSMYDFSSALGTNPLQSGSDVDFNTWIGYSKSTCLEMKSIWGLSISLCVLFGLSVMCVICLWRKKPAEATKGGEV